MASILLVDGNPLIWRAAYGGQYEGIAKTALTHFYEIVNKFSPLDVVVCWDKGKSRWRSASYPDYKAHRVEKKKESELDLEKVQEQANYVRRYLDSVGVRQILVPGVEADDVISWLTERCLDLYSKGRFVGLDGFRVVISTGDQDLWQLVDRHVVVYDHAKGMIIDEEGVFTARGIWPLLIPDQKALSGDASDNLPGVKGVGDITAAKLLDMSSCLGFLLEPNEDMLKEIKRKKATARILDDPDLVSEMYRLVKLPRIRDAVYLLNAEEWPVFVEQATRVPHVVEFERRMMVERIGKSFVSDEAKLSRSSFVDLPGMVAHMSENRAQNPVWNYLEDVDSAVQRCTACTLRSDCGAHGPTLPSGYKDAEIMVVGRNPGAQECENGVPFYPGAPAGSRLDEFLKNVGLTRRECWITNVCKCYSAANRPPTQGEILTCLRYLRAELDLIKPKLVIAFGVEAMAALTSYQSRVTKHCGEILDDPIGGLVGPGRLGAKVAICVHPSAARRSTQAETEMKYAETQVKALLERVTR